MHRTNAHTHTHTLIHLGEEIVETMQRKVFITKLTIFSYFLPVLRKSLCTYAPLFGTASAFPQLRQEQEQECHQAKPALVVT